MGVFMLFSFCKMQIWLELEMETQDSISFISIMRLKASSPIFRAKNRARTGPKVYFGCKNGCINAFSFCKRQIWLELARETQNSISFISIMRLKASSPKISV